MKRRTRDEMAALKAADSVMSADRSEPDGPGWTIVLFLIVVVLARLME